MKTPGKERCVSVADHAKQPQVYNVRGMRVVLDRDLAAYLGMDTKYLKRVVNRNKDALLSDGFVFEMSKDECLRCQIVTLNMGQGQHLKYLPFAFTKEGVLMLEKVLKRSIEIGFEEHEIESVQFEESWSEGTVVLYQPNENIKLDVRVENETVWLTQDQMAVLFGTQRQAISKHIGNIYEVEELQKNQTCSILEQVRHEGTKVVSRQISIYNLDMIISVGFRVNSKNGILFRQWALNVLKNNLLHKHYYDSRLDKLESTVNESVKEISSIKEKIDFIVDTKLPPVEMIFYEGESFKAYDFICSLIEVASERIVLIDNYVDRKVLLMLNKRHHNVKVMVYTQSKSLEDEQFMMDVEEANRKHSEPLIKVIGVREDHDRFLIVDDTVYHLGPSVKDGGVKRCAVIKMTMKPELVLKDIR